MIDDRRMLMKPQIPRTKAQGFRCRVSGVREEKQKSCNLSKIPLCEEGPGFGLPPTAVVMPGRDYGESSRGRFRIPRLVVRPKPSP
jgi:hypothetical protein